MPRRNSPRVANANGPSGLVARWRSDADVLRRRGGEARWLAVITAIVWLGYNAFLLVVYLAVFTVIAWRLNAAYWKNIR